MNNTRNYSFLFDVDSDQPMQHFAFEKGGTGINTEKNSLDVNKQETLISTEESNVLHE